MPQKSKQKQQQRQQPYQQQQPRKAAAQGNCCNSVSSALKTQDQFPTPFSLRIDGADDTLRTLAGTLCSLILMLISVFYGGLKLKVLFDRADVNILTAKKDLYYTDDDIFSYKHHGFNLAVAFTEFNTETAFELPPEYGKLVFNTYSWGADPVTGKIFTERKEIASTHPCTARELGLGEKGADDEEARFFPIHASSAWYIKTYQKKFVCVDKEDLYVYGDFNTGKTRMVNIQLKKCRPGDGVICKREAEITQFFKNKFILLHSNQIRFDSQEWFDKSAISESRAQWLTINTQVKQTLPFKVSTMELLLQDDTLANVQTLTLNKIETVFQLVGQPAISYERPDTSVQVDITVEMDLTLTGLSRDGYTFLDWISDIGGIQGIFISVIALLLSLWNYNHLDNFLATKLYQIRNLSSHNETKTLTFGILGGLKDYLCDSLPSCFQCCRSGRNERGLMKSRDKLEKETNIVTMIQARRYFESAIKLLLPKEQRMRLKEQAKYMIVDLEEEKEMKSKDEDGGEVDNSGISVRSSQIDQENNEKVPEADSMRQIIELEELGLDDENPKQKTPKSKTKEKLMNDPKAEKTNQSKSITGEERGRSGRKNASSRNRRDVSLDSADSDKQQKKSKSSRQQPQRGTKKKSQTRELSDSRQDETRSKFEKKKSKRDHSGSELDETERSDDSYQWKDEIKKKKASSKGQRKPRGN